MQICVAVTINHAARSLRKLRLSCFQPEWKEKENSLKFSYQVKSIKCEVYHERIDTVICLKISQFLTRTFAEMVAKNCSKRIHKHSDCKKIISYSHKFKKTREHFLISIKDASLIQNIKEKNFGTRYSGTGITSLEIPKLLQIKCKL